MFRIRELCKKYTYLTESDIEIIESIASTLQIIADTSNGDVFIDCPTKHKDEAIVVANVKPYNHSNLYNRDVVGELAIRQNEPSVIRCLEIGMPSRDLKGITQEDRKVNQSVEPIRNKEDKIIGALVIEKDITEKLEQRERMQILADANEELANQISMVSDNNHITYYINDAILIFDENGLLRFKNPVADELYKALGYKDDLLGLDFANLSLSNTNFEDVVKNKEISTEDIEIGNMSLQIKCIVQNNKNFKVVMLIRDITDVKEKEKELVLKSVSINEIHHRVKNNLQTIASLLRLQSRRIKNQDFLNAINESMNRILSIAATHEILAKQGLDHVNIKEVLDKIKYSMVIMETGYNIDLEINIKGDDLKVTSDKATSIALVINELIQNSLKHAFKGKEKGKIDINIKEGQIYSSISVVDNGIGFDVNKVEESSLGLSIVKSLVKDKLGGNITIHSHEGGTKVFFDFRN